MLFFQIEVYNTYFSDNLNSCGALVKWPARVISIEHPFKDGNGRFTMIPSLRKLSKLAKKVSLSQVEKLGVGN